MMDKCLYEQLRELAWRRELTPSEQAELRAWFTEHPEDAVDWEAESVLNQGLSGFPDVPVPSNFTALVLQRVERERVPEARASTPSAQVSRWWARLGWLRPVTLTAALLLVGVIARHEVRQAQRRELVESVSLISEVASVPSPEMLRDFEVIRALDHAPAPDDELLRLLQ